MVIVCAKSSLWREFAANDHRGGWAIYLAAAVRINDMTTTWMRRTVVPLAAVALVVTACGDDDDGGNTTSSNNGMSLTIAAPDDGAEISLPFTVEFDSSEDLGPTDDGVHHVHIFWDGEDSEYTVVEADSVEVTEAPEGEHTLNASLRNADHSPAGVETEITVTVGEGGGDDSGDNGGFDY